MSDEGDKEDGESSEGKSRSRQGGAISAFGDSQGDVSMS